MNILVINTGSSSLKFELFHIQKTLISSADGIIENLNKKTSAFHGNIGKKHISFNIKIKSYKQALKIVLDTLLKEKILKNLSEIHAIGHRVVHGGEEYRKATLINKKVIKTVRKLSTLAPLHNPPNLAGILACKKLLPLSPQVAVFDTAFYQTLPEKAYLYAIPYHFYKHDRIRRYGFHGTSHKYITQEVLKLIKKRPLRAVTCHLGNGSSLTASINGIAMDTSLGFTPVEGVPMGTRSGDIDPAIIPYIMKKHRFTPDEINEILNYKSGLKGLSEISPDMRDIYQKAKKGHKKAILAIEIFCYKISKYIGAFAATINGLDAVAFTAGIGENAWYVREKVCNQLAFLGLKLDKNNNQKNKKLISSKESKVKTFVIHTNEELEIAKETYGIVKKAKK